MLAVLTGEELAPVGPEGGFLEVKHLAHLTMLCAKL